MMEKDLGRHIVYSDGRIWSKKLNRYLKHTTTERGYVKVCMQKHKNRSLHRLLAECFIPNPNNYLEINHINGIRDDNRLDNLEWCSASMNQKHAYAIGLKKPMIGEVNHRAKLSNSDIPIIRDCIKAGFTGKDIARYFNVKPTTISTIKLGKKWNKV